MLHLPPNSTLNGHLRIIGYCLRGDQSSTPDRHLEGKHGCRHTVLGGPAGRVSFGGSAATDLFFPNAARLPWAQEVCGSNLRAPTDSPNRIIELAYCPFPCLLHCGASWEQLGTKPRPILRPHRVRKWKQGVCKRPLLLPRWSAPIRFAELLLEFPDRGGECCMCGGACANQSGAVLPADMQKQGASSASCRPIAVRCHLWRTPAR